MGNGQSGQPGPTNPTSAMGAGPPECAEMKAAYDKCFDHWYKTFQGGKWSSADVCEDEFDDFKECYVGAMQKRIAAKGAKK